MTEGTRSPTAPGAKHICGRDIAYAAVRGDRGGAYGHGLQ